MLCWVLACAGTALSTATLPKGLRHLGTNSLTEIGRDPPIRARASPSFLFFLTGNHEVMFEITVIVVSPTRAASCRPVRAGHSCLFSWGLVLKAASLWGVGSLLSYSGRKAVPGRQVPLSLCR